MLRTTNRRTVASLLTLATLALAALLSGCTSTPKTDPECVRRCDVEWEACLMECDRRKMGCDARCGENETCLDRCRAAYPRSRQRCDDPHGTCLEACESS